MAKHEDECETCRNFELPREITVESLIPVIDYVRRHGDAIKSHKFCDWAVEYGDKLLDDSFVKAAHAEYRRRNER